MRRPFGVVEACAVVLAFSPVLHAATNPAPEPADTRLPLEACAKWSERNGSFGFTNECSEPVALLFIELNGPRRFDRVIKPHERFDINLSEEAINAAGWLFTACPANYVPNVPFTAKHQVQIVRSQYECVHK